MWKQAEKQRQEITSEKLINAAYNKEVEYVYVHKNISKQTGYCRYETVNTVKIQIRIQNHRSTAQDPIKCQ